MRPNRSIPAATVIPMLIFPDVRDASAGLQWTFSETIHDVPPEAGAACR